MWNSRRLSDVFFLERDREKETTGGKIKKIFFIISKEKETTQFQLFFSSLLFEIF